MLSKQQSSLIITYFFGLIIVVSLLNQFNFLSTEIISFTHFTGFGARMNPYNSARSYTEDEIKVIFIDNQEIIIHMDQLIPSFYPTYLKGSFKYFYRESKLPIETNIRVSLKLCQLIQNKLSHQPKRIEVKLFLPVKNETKEYLCFK
ncbi:MAG: hypothetical protein H7281_04495 [Bacteriovorax sp.]|nr:hypothetical protein [Bacteriovorax sp.]